MLSQTVNKCPGWNHEIAIGWRSKKMDSHKKWVFLSSYNGDMVGSLCPSKIFIEM